MKPEGDFTPPGGIDDYVEWKQWLLGFHVCIHSTPHLTRSTFLST